MARDRKKTDLIVIHCSATTPGMNTEIEDIHEWHLMEKIRSPRGRTGYHFVIHRDGSIHKGRDLMEMGAHARGYNDRSVGICLSGGLNEEFEPESNFTPAQWASLEILVRGLMHKLFIPKVIGHNEISNKACPSFDVQEWARSKGIA